MTQSPEDATFAHILPLLVLPQRGEMFLKHGEESTLSSRLPRGWKPGPENRMTTVEPQISPTVSSTVSLTSLPAVSPTASPTSSPDERPGTPYDNQGDGDGGCVLVLPLLILPPPRSSRPLPFSLFFPFFSLTGFQVQHLARPRRVRQLRHDFWPKSSFISHIYQPTHACGLHTPVIYLHLRI